MNGFDYLMLAVLAAFTLMGALRGFVLEVLSLVLWPLSALAAWLLADAVAPWYAGVLSDPALRLVAGFVTVFLVAFIVGAVAVYLINRLLPLKGALRAPNVVLGGAAGLTRGGIILVIVFLVGGITSLPQRPWWRESLLAPYVERTALAVKTYLPADVARHIRYG